MPVSTSTDEGRGVRVNAVAPSYTVTEMTTSKSEVIIGASSTFVLPAAK